LAARRPTTSLVAAIGAAVAVLACAGEARAGSMDPATERMVLQPGSSAFCAGASFCPDNIAFANLISELGFALSPDAFHPARTTGFGGFALTFEAAFTHVNNDASSTAVDGSKTQYWHMGTRGPTDPNTKSFPTTNSSPDSVLQVYQLKARKGLPLGFEVTPVLGFMANSSLWMLGADVRWAPFEGFRTGAGGILPDISVGGGVRTVMGTDRFSLTTVTMDGQLSKPIPIGETFTLTPYVGFQHLWVFGDSAVVDTTPNIDPVAQCGYQKADPVTGQPVCQNTLPNGQPNNADFNNNVVFNKVRTTRNRGIIGLNYRYEMVYLAGQILFDLTDPRDDNQGFLQAARQWTLSFEAGAFF